MDNPANHERQAFRHWQDFQALDRLCKRLSKLPPRMAVTDAATLKRLGLPRNTRAAVAHETATQALDRARQRASSTAQSCFEQLARLQQPLGRSLDVLQHGKPTRRLLLDEVFVVTQPRTSWISSSSYSLLGADLEADLAPIVLTVDANDDFVDLSP